MLLELQVSNFSFNLKTFYVMCINIKIKIKNKYTNKKIVKNTTPLHFSEVAVVYSLVHINYGLNMEA